MKSLTADTITALHRLMTDASGGSHGLRDRGLLESAAASPYQAFGGVEAYPTLAEKAARLCYALVANHSFVDGNKRIGIFVMLVFLEVNGICLNCTNEDVVDFGLSVASGDMKYDEILEWINLDEQDEVYKAIGKIKQFAEAEPNPVVLKIKDIGVGNLLLENGNPVKQKDLALVKYCSFRCKDNFDLSMDNVEYESLN